jgi:putative copper export protein
MQVILGLVHGLDDLLTSLLVGSAFFSVVIASAGGTAGIELLRDWPRRLRVLCGLLFVISCVWMLLSLHDMTDSWTTSDMWQAASVTRMGHLWCAKLVVLGFLYFSLHGMSASPLASLLLLVVLFILPFFSVLSGHAASQNNLTALRIFIDWVHSAAIAIWIGGLLTLYIWLGNRKAAEFVRPNVSMSVVRRFSHFAMASTALIGLTGFAMAYLSGVPLFRPCASVYGTLIIAKLAFFSLALCAAAVNQFAHMRHLRPENEMQCCKSVRREVMIEMIFVCIIFSLAGFLARTALPGE